jgi:uncharacterized membrane protein YraQ (UPF0718 family)
MVSSPLTSPEELFYSAGLFGWNFAIAFFVASIVLGLMGGAIANFAESRGWLKNQARMSASQSPSLSLGIMGGPAPLDLPIIPQPVESTQCTCGSMPAALPVLSPPTVEATQCSCSSSSTVSAASAKPTVTLSTFLTELWNISKRLLPLFFGFTFVGYLLNGLIPATWILSLFGSGHAYSIPLAATLGLPFYINTEASLPLVRAMIESGMSQGAALAFLITGAGTSIGAIGGALTIARWRVIAIVIGTLWAGSILIGFAYNLFL